MIGTMTAGTIALLAGGVAAKTAADIYGAKKAGDAAKQAGNQAAAANQAALDYQKEQDALDREDARRAELENQGRYTREQARAAAVYGDEAAAAARAEDAARRGEAFDQSTYYTREAQRKPYREASLGTLASALAKRGITIRPSAGFEAAPGWSSQSLAPSTASAPRGTDLASLG